MFSPITIFSPSFLLRTSIGKSPGVVGGEQSLVSDDKVQEHSLSKAVLMPNAFETPGEHDLKSSASMI
jgi:hypothetical protein